MHGRTLEVRFMSEVWSHAVQPTHPTITSRVDKKELLTVATAPKKRERPIIDECQHGDSYSTTKAGVKTLLTPGKLTRCVGRQITVSEGHRRMPKKKGGNYVEGGPFYTVKRVPNIQWVNAHLTWLRLNGSTATYSGPLICPFLPQTMSDSTVPKYGSDSDLDPIGAEAITYSNPAKPNAQLGVALAEIAKDRSVPIPGMQGWKRRTEIAKAAGSEYLNAVFGWLPLVEEIQNTFDSIAGYNNILHNYHFNSGKDERREFGFDPVITETNTTISTKAEAYSGAGTGPGDKATVKGEATVHTEKVINRWFSGSFTYHAGEADRIPKMLGVGSDAERLFGLSLTPDILWELSPWSWAIDWFSNASQVINNFTTMELGDQVMRYGFIMEEISIKEFYNLSHHGLNSDSGFNGTIPTSIFETTLKRRKEANPFGFGVKWEGLSPTQLAITAALGITRLR